MTATESLVITSLADRPHLCERIYEIADNWPPYIPHDLIGNSLLGRVPEEFPQFCVVATEGDRVVARGLSVPFDASGAEREETPDQGWDRVLSWAFEDRHEGRTPTLASALEITLDTAWLGRGLSSRMLAALRETVARQGHDVLLAPVRPTAKHLEPRVPMGEYVLRRRGDGLPEDPWLRVHARAGGEVVKVAPASMTVSGSLAQWREWTGLPFDREGGIEVPGGLVPVLCHPEHDRAVYVEPNVWVRHGAAAGSGGGAAGNGARAGS